MVKRKETDVYSFGVVLLELTSRKKPSDPSLPEDIDFVSWVRSIWNNTKTIEEIVDPTLVREFRDPTIEKEATMRPNQVSVVDDNEQAHGSLAWMVVLIVSFLFTLHDNLLYHFGASMAFGKLC
ncbi:hypothetical protein NE237_029988 [Protea cynaroides]|uniref:Serine-threonine/tyrosine-protein kinase catalytic domain-containing protein n=1 Tax=Protea cynaroides TaxID=273540 RepID=A0A9Q0GU80_9MAGN|nr:hypothetical protein NE237_029988 [Protea cynaroides]